MINRSTSDIFIMQTVSNLVCKKNYTVVPFLMSIIPFLVLVKGGYIKGVVLKGRGGNKVYDLAL
jgi:hypothetical protein